METEFIKAHKSIKEGAELLSLSSSEERNQALLNVKNALSANLDEIRKANKADLQRAEKDGLKSTLIHRLELTDDKISSILEGIDNLIKLPDPIGRIKEKRELDANFVLSKKTFPIGVIGMIFESRPDALIQIATLCLKSGNGVFVKGGKEAKETNKVLVKIIDEATKNLVDKSKWIENLETHEDVDGLLKAEGLVDLIIPRGSNQFVSFVMDNTRIPVIGHSDGICSIYVDKDIPENQEVFNIIIDSKTNYPAACNSVETLLLNSELSSNFLIRLINELKENDVIIHAPERMLELDKSLISVKDIDYDTEYLDKEIAIKFVNNLDEAIKHINTHGSHHTDAIISTNKENIENFYNRVDSADVFSNCSTRFADGFRFGLGAEVGISTSKIHARGPVGLDGLVTTKWILEGNGEIVSSYQGKNAKSFKFKELM